MISNEEILLLGQPIKITIPGKLGEGNTSKYKGRPVLRGGDVYNGYAMCDIYSLCYTSIDNIYIQINDIFYILSDWYCFFYEVSDYISEVQSEVTFDKVRKMCLLLYNKINRLEEQLNDKVDRE